MKQTPVMIPPLHVTTATRGLYTDTDTDVGTGAGTPTARLLDRLDVPSGSRATQCLGRRYLVEPDQLEAALESLSHVGRLEMSDGTSATVTAEYFDTTGLDSWESSARGRGCSWEARRRSIGNATWLEVQTRNVDGVTTTARRHLHETEEETGGALLEDGVSAWIGDRLAAAGINGIDPSGLVSTFQARSTRVTYHLPDSSGDVTVDRDLHWVSWIGTAEPTPALLTARAPTVCPDHVTQPPLQGRLLPADLSIYGIGLALLTPDLQASRWPALVSYLRARTTMVEGVLG